MISQTSGNPEKDELPNIKIAQHLARHHVKVMTKTLTEGAYGHSRLREIVLGGMTRDIMQSMTVPVLMSH